MRVDAYYCLHYGREWFEWSLRSIRPFVDRIHVFYSDHPSHGQTTRRQCPEGRDELYEIAHAFKPYSWHDMSQTTRYEGQHRDFAVNWCRENGADVLLAIDADEVWDPDDLSDSLDQIERTPVYKHLSKVKQHFWKGVNWACHDASMPVRFFDFRYPEGENALSGPGFYHFGYAQSLRLVTYKMAIHGHRSELRRNWAKLYADWKGPGDTPLCGVHPTCECDDRTGQAFWTPEPFDRQEIAHLVGDHPYFSDDLI